MMKMIEKINHSLVFMLLGSFACLMVLYVGLNFVRTHIPEGRYLYSEVIPYTDTDPEISADHILQVLPQRQYIYSFNSQAGFARVQGTYKKNINGTVDFFVASNIEADETNPTITYSNGQRLFYLSPATTSKNFLIHWDLVSPLIKDAPNPLFTLDE